MTSKTILFRLFSAPHWSLFPSSLETNKKPHIFFLVWEFYFFHAPKHFKKSLIFLPKRTCHLENLLFPFATRYSGITWPFNMDICQQKSAFLLAFGLLICFALASTFIFIHFYLLFMYNPVWKEATVFEFSSVPIREKEEREVVQSLFLQVFKTWLAKSLRNVVYLRADPALGRGLAQRPPKIPSNLNYLLILSSEMKGQFLKKWLGVNGDYRRTIYISVSSKIIHCKDFDVSWKVIIFFRGKKNTWRFWTIILVQSIAATHGCSSFYQ